jgi:hypothetical protein
MPKFKPGDVVHYGQGNGVAIVSDRGVIAQQVKFQAWGNEAGILEGRLGAWCHLCDQGSMPVTSCRPHPDPDKILVAYAKACLK